MTKIERGNLKVILKDIPNVCLTVNFRTSIANNSSLGITCYDLDDWKLLNRILKTVKIPEWLL